MDHIPQLIQEGIEQPRRIPKFLIRKFRNPYFDFKYERYRNKRDIVPQERRLDELLDEKEFVLIILDACRFDYFQEAHRKILSGSLEMVWSPGNRTPQWVPRLWNNQYDITYVSASSYPVSEKSWTGKRRSFDPETTFSRVVPVFERDDILSTVPPEFVTDAALHEIKNMQTTRCVVHYVQPHSPYIGETKLLPWFLDEAEANHVLEDNSNLASVEKTEAGFPVHELLELGVHEDVLRAKLKDRDKYYPKNQVMDGIVSQNQYHRAYRDNLLHVLREANRLIQYLECPVVITSDHGEHLGNHFDELWEYNHPGRTHPVLREIPWFSVDIDSIDTKSIQNISTRTPSKQTSHSKAEIEEHLEALGYI